MTMELGRKGYDEESTNNRDMHIQTENEDEQLEYYFISCLTFEMVCLDDISLACCTLSNRIIFSKQEGFNSRERERKITSRK